MNARSWLLQHKCVSQELGSRPGYCPNGIWGMISRAEGVFLGYSKHKDHNSCSCPGLGTINVTGAICIILLFFPGTNHSFLISFGPAAYLCEDS